MIAGSGRAHVSESERFAGDRSNDSGENLCESGERNAGDTAIADNVDDKQNGCSFMLLFLSTTDKTKRPPISNTYERPLFSQKHVPFRFEMTIQRCQK
jgi:hypothetical protein